MLVKDLIHMKKYKAAEIFSSACSGCHVDRGKGRKGFDLFINDCMMCHITAKSASPLAVLRAKNKEDVERAIRGGVGKTSMPGWDARHGGPLSEDEIRGLIDYIGPVSPKSGN
ncbi:MAG: c-type cytochrome [Acidobacteriota bacterium]